MSWYEKLKTEKILVQQSSEHNKFWAGKLDESTCSVIVRWGRIGTKGQSQTKTFSSAYSAADHLDTKLREKMRKGYTSKLDGETIDAAKLEELAIRAAIVGTQNKCHKMQWVEITQEGSTFGFKAISDERLYEPDCVPGLLVAMETRKEYDGLTSFNILFTGDAAFTANTPKTLEVGVTTGKIEKTDKLYQLTKKVEEAVGRSLS